MPLMGILIWGLVAPCLLFDNTDLFPTQLTVEAEMSLMTSSYRAIPWAPIIDWFTIIYTTHAFQLEGTQLPNDASLMASTLFIHLGVCMTSLIASLNGTSMIYHQVMTRNTHVWNLLVGILTMGWCYHCIVW